MAWQEVVLIVDPSASDAADLAERLAAPSRIVHRAGSLPEAVGLLGDLDPDLAVVSLELPELPGPRVVRMLRDKQRNLQVVATTTNPDPSVAVAAVRAGAADYLGKPVDPERLAQAVGRALRHLQTERALDDTQQLVRDRYGFHDLLSRSPKMHAVFDQIRDVAPTDATVLVTGETGTGKELVARAIHDGSRRADGPFVSANCGAFAHGLLESELFGHERGSFTGAVQARVGVFELSHEGTLFLDELAQTSLDLQVKLLRVLEEMQFRRVGGEKPVTVDVRIVAATNADLEQGVREGTFREDLYYRLNVFPIRLPPLRERREDIPILLHHFLEGAAREYGVAPPKISADALHWIQHHDWPGNVRQLRAMCERWAIVARGRTLLKEMLPTDMQRPGRSFDAPSGLAVEEDQPLAPQLDRLQQQFEKAYLHRVLLLHEGHLQKAAKHAGMSRRTLYTKMKQFGLDAETYRVR